jgi:hypothetical protein
MTLTEKTTRAAMDAGFGVACANSRRYMGKPWMPDNRVWSLHRAGEAIPLMRRATLYEIAVYVADRAAGGLGV